MLISVFFATEQLGDLTVNVEMVKFALVHIHCRPAGSKLVFYKGPIVILWAFQAKLSFYIKKTAVNNMWTNESDCVPIKLYLWKQRAVLIWPINLWAAKPVVDYHADVKDSEINLQVVTGKDIHSMCGVVVLIAQLCLTLQPMDCSLPGPSVHGIFQARILEWVAIPFFRGPSGHRDRTWVSCIAGRFFSIWSTREAHNSACYRYILFVILSLFVALFLLKR